MSSVKPDYRVILEMIADGSSVLDLGCGNGELLALLAEQRHIRGQGIEIDQKAIAECVRRGVNVLHGNLDEGLSDYPDKSFDFVILNGSLPEVRQPKSVLLEALRVGRRVVVGFPNFCHLKARLQIFFLGKVPVTLSLPSRWYDTANLHFLSIKDFVMFCREERLHVISAAHLFRSHRIRLAPNLLANYSIFLLEAEVR